MIAQVDSLIHHRPAAAKPWLEFVDLRERRHLAAAFSFGSQTSWAGSYKPGELFDNLCMLTLTPSEIRNTPIIIFTDDSISTSIIIKESHIHNHIIVFPPAHYPAREPLFLLHRVTHFTVLRSTNPSDNSRYYSLIEQLIPPLGRWTHLPTDHLSSHINLDAIVHILCNNSSATDLHTLRTNHSIFLRILEERYSLDRPAPPVHTDKHFSSGTSSQPIVISDDADIGGIDLIAPHQSLPPPSTSRARRPLKPTPGDPLISATPPSDNTRLDELTALGPHPRCHSPSRSHSRSPSPSQHASPRKAPSLGHSPPRASLGRTPRSTASEPTSPHSPSSLLHDSHSPSSNNVTQQTPSINSETDLGALVQKTCGRNDSRFAATIGVRGYASSDETSISGSLYTSSQSATTSQTPSLYSTGSFHPAPIPSHAERPRCKCNRTMQFGCFTEDNHACDAPDCSKHISAGAFGWHCEVCSFDFCIQCCRPDFPFTQNTSQHTLDDSLSTMQLNSSSPTTHSDMVALDHQLGADAAASGRGHHA
jgi:hypothetical protein